MTSAGWTPVRAIPSDCPPRPSWTYLLQETACILGLGYLVLAGGTLNGLMRFPLHLMSHVLIAIVLIAWLTTVLWRRQGVAASGLEVGLLVAFGAAGLATVLSVDPRRSLGWLGLMVVYALWLYLALDLLRHGWPAELFVKVLLIVGGIIIAWGLIEAGSWLAAWLQQPGAGRVAIGSLRVYSLLGDANMLSAFLNLLLPLALVRLLRERRWAPRLFLLVWTAGNLVLQFFTSSRGGWLGTVVVLACLAALLWIANPDDWRVRLTVWARRWLGRPWARLLLPTVGLAILMGIAYLALRQLQHPSHGDIWLARREFWQTAWQVFLSSPLHGAGPFTYGTEFFKYVPVPPWRPYPHAHSVPLTALAEGGILGILALLALLGVTVRVLWRTWQHVIPSQRWLLCGALASLAGFATHSLMDNHTVIPSIAMTAVGVLAVALSTARTAPRTDDVTAERRLAVGWLVVPAALLIVSCFASDWAYAPFSAGVGLANAGDWTGAALQMDIAARRNGRLAFYHLQRGYAWGVVAAGGAGGANPSAIAGAGRGNPSVVAGAGRGNPSVVAQALDAAVRAYERGVTLEPNYSVNHANLAALYWQAGRRDEAIAEMARARELAPGAAIFALNLARYYEDLNQPDRAAENYAVVLAARPDLAEATHYWKRTPIRRQALEAWQNAHVASSTSAVPAQPVSADDYLAVGRAAYATQDWAAAEAAFARAQALAPARLDTYLGLGQAAMSGGHFDAADRVLRLGLSTYAPDEGQKLPLLLAYAQLAHDQGRTEDAVRRGDAAFAMVEKPTLYGRGTMGWSPYGWFLFQRESIAPDLLPQLARLEITDPLADRFVDLGRWYEELGRPQDAAGTYRRILALVPDWEPALQGLSRVLASTELQGGSIP